MITELWYVRNTAGKVFGPIDLESLKDGQAVEFASVRAPSEDIWMAYSASLPIGSHTEHPDGRRPQTVFFCDYASAGNLWQPSNAYRVWFPMELGPAD